MIDYKVSIEKNGQRIVVGRLKGENSADTCFTYDAGYLASEDAQAISVNLPLTGTAFSAEQTRLYFEGLLPEGYIRMSLADSMHFEQEDYVSLLHVLGCECLGAIMISDENEEYDASYVALSNKQLSDFAKEGASKSVELVKKSRLSLAGASGKAGLYYDEKKGKWYLPVGTAPSTHIVKQSHVRLDALVLNEQLCMLTAKLCGIDVPSGFVVNTGSGLDDSVLFATKRYDRVFAENP
ncbi:MAG: HipA N-terminal domain-containing protein, partial [Firmicutes bacterium]|nr:HipA N-terminal domain-containing protein [Bacillota bacterium]